MRRIWERPFQFVSGRDNKKAPSNLRNAKIRCLKNTVRDMIAQIFQFALDDSEYGFAIVRACVLNVRNILHDDVIRLQRLRHAQEFDEQRISRVGRIARVLAANGKALTWRATEQNIRLPVSRTVSRKFIITHQLNVPRDDQRILVIVGKRLACP